MPKTKPSELNRKALQRLCQKRRYDEIKNDPELLALEQEKRRQKYKKSKEQGKRKAIAKLSPRAQSEQRKKWKENSKRYRRRQKSNAEKDKPFDGEIIEPADDLKISQPEQSENLLHQQTGLVVSEEPADIDSEIQMPELKVEEEEMTIEDSLEPTQDPLQETTAETSSINTFTVTLPPPTHRRQLRRFDDSAVLSALQRLEHTVTEVVDTTQLQKIQQLQTQDEFHMFALSVAAQLRELPVHVAIETQSKIQSTLCEARLASIFSNSLPMTSLDMTVKTEDEMS